jgi:uncharacterized ferritin-like protein (DUF455 family)
MSHAVVRGLRARGVDVITALEEGMIERDDQEHLEHAGLILARQQQFTLGEQLRRLLRLIAKVPADQIKNRVEFLGAWG